MTPQNVHNGSEACSRRSENNPVENSNSFARGANGTTDAAVLFHQQVSGVEPVATGDFFLRITTKDGCSQSMHKRAIAN
jgi:hypothetical protein